MNNATIIDTMVNDALTDAFNHYHMMITAENVVINMALQEKNLTSSQQTASRNVKKQSLKANLMMRSFRFPVKVKKGDG